MVFSNFMPVVTEDGSWFCPPRTPWNDEFICNMYIIKAYFNGLPAVNTDEIIKYRRKALFLLKKSPFF